MSTKCGISALKCLNVLFMYIVRCEQWHNVSAGCPCPGELTIATTTATAAAPTTFHLVL